MPSESDKPIEKQLRDYAARRRAVAGKDSFGLHPVTRNILQVEVEQEFGRAGRSGNQAVPWSDWWPMFAWGGGALVALCILAVAFVQFDRRKSAEKLAMSDKPAGDESALGGTVSNPTEVNSPATLSAASSQSVSSLSVTPSASQPLDPRRQEFQFAARNPASNRSLPMVAAVVPESTAPAESRAFTGRGGGATPMGETRRATAKSVNPTVALVLPLQRSFRVTIVDDRISILDADQSSYSGRLQPMDPRDSFVAGGALPNSPPRAITDPDELFRRRYFEYTQGGVTRQVPLAASFTLTGTNVATHLPVQIVGQMVTQTQAVPASVSAEKPSAADALSGAGVFLQIQGSATMNGQATFPIDASTEPQ